jgi:hypothetical protein
MIVSIANCPPITDEETDKIGFFYSQCAADPAKKFKSATVFKGPTANGPWIDALSGKLKHESPLGTVIESTTIGAALPFATAPDGRGLDTINHLDVQMLHGTLTPQTEDEFWFEPYYFLVGSHEVLAAKTITTLSPINVTVTATVNSSNQITRATGNWETDGVWKGQYVRIAGFADPDSNTFRRVVAVTLTVITVDGPSMTAETAVPNVTFVFNESGAYRLTNLYRGLRDTRNHVDNSEVPNSLPVAGDRVIPLRGPWVEWIPIDKGQVGKTKFVKVVPKGLTLIDVAATPLVVTGETARPFRPGHLHWLWDNSSGDFEPILRWVHRSRSPEADETSTTLHDLIDEKEVYEVQIATTDDFSSPVRVEVVKFLLHEDQRVCAFRYTFAKMVTTDGFTEGAAFWWRVRQRGTWVNDGNWSESQNVQAQATFGAPTGGMAAAEAEEH